MTILFNRQANILLGTREESAREDDKFSGLRVSFDIEKDLTSNANKGKIEIYNFPRDKWARIDREGDVYAMLEIGYSNNMHLLFTGDINANKANIEKRGTDWIVTLDLKDGETTLQDCHIDKSYPPGTTYAQIIKDAANLFHSTGKLGTGRAINKLNEPYFQKKTLTGMTISNNTKKVLDDLLATINYDWFVTDHEMHILGEDEDIGETMLYLSYNTGLINEPVKVKEGIKIKALIPYSKVNPGQLVQLESTFLDAICKIDKIKYIGDTHVTPWYIECECHLVKRNTWISIQQDSWGMPYVTG